MKRCGAKLPLTYLYVLRNSSVKLDTLLTNPFLRNGKALEIAATRSDGGCAGSKNIAARHFPFCRYVNLGDPRIPIKGKIDVMRLSFDNFRQCRTIKVWV